MKNKFCYILLCLFTTFAFMGNVFAGEFSVSVVTDNNEVVKGNDALVKIKLTADEVIAACKFVVSVEGDLVKKSQTPGAGMIVSLEGDFGFTVEANSLDANAEKPNDFEILTLNYTINGTGKVTVKTEKCVSLVDENNYTAQDSSVSFTVVEPVDDTALKSLKVVGGENITLQNGEFSYGTSLNDTTFGLEIVANNEEYQDKIVVKDEEGNVITDINNIKFNDPTNRGGMQLYIIVNEKTTYDLWLNYVAPTELDNSLSSIVINGSELLLEKDKTEYELDVDSDVNLINISVSLKDDVNFQIGKNSNIDGTTGSFTITDSVDVIIVVEPKSSDLGVASKRYTINVKKKKGGSSNTGNNNDDNKKPSVDNEGNVTENQATGDISKFIMAFILVASLVGSIVLYQRNLESYK